MEEVWGRQIIEKRNLQSIVHYDILKAKKINKFTI